MLLTKLHIPPAGNNTVHRPELFEKLNTGLSRKLILVSAPAGYGKTTVVSNWIDKNKIPTAWFSLDNGDNDPVNFLSYIISGIKSIHKEFGDSVQFSLAVYGDTQVEFFGKPVFNKNPYSTGKEISRYDIWISKSNDLPYRYRRYLSHSTSWEACRDVKINNISIEDFVPAYYFPPDYKIAVKGKGESIKIDLSGKIAPDWTLKDFDGNPVALKDLKSKILIIEFTGIGCGPCHASIPFLKQLMTEYKSEYFELVSIETWSKNLEGIKRYYINNKLNYKYLVSSKELVKDYQVRGVPALFILDEHRVIRRVIAGYERETTDKEIRDIIDSLI